MLRTSVHSTSGASSTGRMRLRRQRSRICWRMPNLSYTLSTYSRTTCYCCEAAKFSVLLIASYWELRRERRQHGTRVFLVSISMSMFILEMQMVRESRVSLHIGRATEMLGGK